MLKIGHSEPLDKKRSRKHSSDETEIEIDNQRTIGLSCFVNENHSQTTEATTQKPPNVTRIKKVKIWVDKDVNAQQTHPNEEEFPHFDCCSEEEEGKENGEKREGVEENDGVGERNHRNGFEETKKGQRPRKSS